MQIFGRKMAYPVKPLQKPDEVGVSTIHITRAFDPDISLTGREIYRTNDDVEIEVLSKDPEIVELETTKKGVVRVKKN
jgi:predicted alpha/beta-hydrolase family hydrolase